MTGTIAPSTWPMGVLAGVAALGRRIEEASAAVGNRVGRDWVRALDPPGGRSGSCSIERCADGWIAVNLARPDDRAAVPAWLAVAGGEALSDCTGAALVEAATLLGLPAGLVGERAADPTGGVMVHGRAPATGRRLRPVVVDLSALWAGPLVGALLAEAGCDVVKVESTSRPDALRIGDPVRYRELNGQKAYLRLDFGSSSGRAALRAIVEGADVVITSARRRALLELGTEPGRIRPGSVPRSVWISITGHGLASDRVAFGDDAAAAGGLVRWEDEAPHLVGGALADPLSGMAGAAAAMELLAAGEGGLLDVAMAGVAAAHR